ncbi:Myblike DNAbinding domain-containing protein [Perkinsus chesapeaki]|uniref:Myblike DNAbinding domain-containing protein n=1 Tax=Perkinsus chesapeaki TaxID=330153 RepID=A0A7J6N3Q9_PERCH|nr:Myblike DNAbinding domain-containing protein [Perkinsus chesapeaki]
MSSSRPDCIGDDSNVPSKLVEAYERDQYAIANLRPLSATRVLSRDIKEDREAVEWAVVEYVKEGIMNSLFNEESGKSSPEVRDKIRQLVDNCDGYNEIEQLATQLDVVVEINWRRVYELLISQSGRESLEWRHCRTPACARALWQHQLAPGINTSEYTREEDTQLLKLAEKHHYLDWASIAAELGTNRTPCSCFQRYHRSLDPVAVPKTFTREQEETLLKYAEKHGKGCWNEIAYEMGTHHTPAQLRQRYGKLISKRHRGIGSMWTVEENKRLKMAVKMVECSGKRIDWGLVAELVRDRTNMSCRERYEKICHESEGYDQEPWTEEESELLKALVDEFGPKWSLISQSFVKRSDNFLLRKWNEIADEEDVKRIKEERETRRAVMRGGLIPDERPEILPSDFKRLITAESEPSTSQTSEQQQGAQGGEQRQEAQGGERVS